MQPLAVVALGFAMHFADQRAGGVNIEKVPAFGFRRHRLGYAMRGEDDRNVVRHLIQFVDEHRANRLEVGDDKSIVNDFVAHVDRCAVFLDCLLNDLHCAINAGAKAAGFGQQYGQAGFGHHLALLRRLLGHFLSGVGPSATVAWLGRRSSAGCKPCVICWL